MNKGYEVYDVYEERGISAKTGNYRPEFERLKRNETYQEKIELGNGFKMIKPRSFEKENIDSNKVLTIHIKAMQNRDGFAIPLGEDKYFFTKR